MNQTNEQDQIRVKAQLEIMQNIINEENSLFVNKAGLAVALIVVMTLNKELINLTVIEGKVLLTIFLGVIVVVLSVHSFGLGYAKNKSIEIIEDIIKKQIISDMSVTFTQRFISHIPLAVNTIFIGAILYVICRLWS